MFDFVIVIFAIISMSMDSNATKNLSIFKTFRICRILRPLRVISRSF